MNKITESKWSTMRERLLEPDSYTGYMKEIAILRLWEIVEIDRHKLKRVLDDIEIRASIGNLTESDKMLITLFKAMTGF